MFRTTSAAPHGHGDAGDTGGAEQQSIVQHGASEELACVNVVKVFGAEKPPSYDRRQSWRAPGPQRTALSA